MRRTQRHLRDALVALIVERGWDAVTVRDVCDRADVGRSTFYVHFADKENLLLSGFDDLHAALDGHRKLSSQPFAFAEPLVRHAAENRELLSATAGRQSGQQVQWRFRDIVTQLVDDELDARNLPKAARTAAGRFIAGGFVEMLLGWLESPQDVAHEELASSFRGLALAVLQAAERGKSMTASKR